VLVIGAGYRRIADARCSATTIRTRRDEWIHRGIVEELELIVLQAYDRFIGLQLSDIPVDGCHTKATGGGEVAGPPPVDRSKGRMKRSTATDAVGIPPGAVSAPGNRHDSPLPEHTPQRLERLGPCPRKRRSTSTPPTDPAKAQPPRHSSGSAPRPR
jgi:hypothetical protein